MIHDPSPSTNPRFRRAARQQQTVPVLSLTPLSRSPEPRQNDLAGRSRRQSQSTWRVRPCPSRLSPVHTSPVCRPCGSPPHAALALYPVAGRRPRVRARPAGLRWAVEGSCPLAADPDVARDRWIDGTQSSTRTPVTARDDWVGPRHHTSTMDLPPPSDGDSPPRPTSGWMPDAGTGGSGSDDEAGAAAADPQSSLSDLALEARTAGVPRTLPAIVV